MKTRTILSLNLVSLILIFVICSVLAFLNSFTIGIIVTIVSYCSMMLYIILGQKAKRESKRHEKDIQ